MNKNADFLLKSIIFQLNLTVLIRIPDFEEYTDSEPKLTKILQKCRNKQKISSLVYLGWVNDE